MATRAHPRNQWTHELDDFVRGASGGFLFSIPLLYTMEAWWIGSFIDPPRMFAGLVASSARRSTSNPPAQVDPIGHFFQPAFLEVEQMGQGSMVVGIIIGVFIAGVVGQRMLGRVSSSFTTPVDMPCIVPMILDMPPLSAEV